MLGDKLKELRGQSRTQEDVAKSIGVSRAAYSHFENNRNQPDNETLAKLAKYFNVTTDYLLGVNNTPQWATEKDVIDLKDVLEGKTQPSFNYGGEKITDDQRAKLNLALTQAFWDVIKNDKERGDHNAK